MPGTSLDRSLTGLHVEATGRLFSAEERATARVPARLAFEEFLEAVRAGLGLPQIPGRFYDDTRLTPGPLAGTSLP
jgi:hypothetical protein